MMGILDFREETQFSAQLHFDMCELPPNAIWQRKLYVEEGHGGNAPYEKVLLNFNALQTLQKLIIMGGGSCPL